MNIRAFAPQRVSFSRSRFGMSIGLTGRAFFCRHTKVAGLSLSSQGPRKYMSWDIETLLHPNLPLTFSFGLENNPRFPVMF